MKILVIIAVIAVLSGCASLPVKLHQEKYIVLEKHAPESISIDGVIIPYSEFNADKVKEVSIMYNSKDFLLGLNTEFTMGDFLKLLPHLSSAEVNTYFLDSNKDIKTLNYAN